MSLENHVNVDCPQCGLDQPYTAWASINTHESPALRLKVLEGTSHRFQCIRCQYVSYMPYDVLYNDPHRRFKIWLKHPDEAGVSAVDPAATRLFDAFSEGWIHRVVRSLGELREKVLVLEDGYSDVEMEALKLLVTMANKLDIAVPLAYEGFVEKRKLFKSDRLIQLRQYFEDESYRDFEVSEKQHLAAAEKQSKGVIANSSDWPIVDREFILQAWIAMGRLAPA